MKKYKLFYIDPQSYGNLSIYDYNLLSNVPDKVLYIHSKKYDYYPLDNISHMAIFKYNDIKALWLKFLSYAMSYVHLFFLIMRYRPEAIHVQWLKIPHTDYLFFRIVKMLFGTKLIFTAHNILPRYNTRCYVGVFRKIYNSFDNIIVHTADSLTKIAHDFDVDTSHINVIPHGILSIKTDKAKYEKASIEYDKYYNLKGKMVFTSLGEQSPYKGVDLIAKVWKETPELYDNDNLRLLIIGKQKSIDLSDLQDCSNVIIDNRRIPNLEFVYLLRHTDLYLMPYRDISQSGALLTALAEQIPIMVTNKGGLVEPFGIGKVGWIIDTLTENNIRKILLNVIKNPEELTNIQQNKDLWWHIANYYNWKRIGFMTSNVYNS